MPRACCVHHKLFRAIDARVVGQGHSATRLVRGGGGIGGVPPARRLRLYREVGAGHWRVPGLRGLQRAVREALPPCLQRWPLRAIQVVHYTTLCYALLEGHARARG